MSQKVTAMVYIASYEETFKQLPTVLEIEEACYLATHIARRYLRQYQIFCYIDEFIDSHKYSPSMREIAQHMRLSTSVVSDLVQRLMLEGFVGYTPGIARSLRILKYLTHSLQRVEE